jgi:hypothetical protein
LTAILFAVQSATAAVATFDLRQETTGTLSPTENLSAGGLKLEISGWWGTSNENSPFSNLPPENLWRSSTSGMGIKVASGDNVQIDGRGPAELMRFRFDQKVQLKRVVFSAIDDNDNMDMSIDNLDVAVVTTFNSDNLRAITNSSGALNFPDFVTLNVTGLPSRHPVGSEFAFYTNGRNDNYKIMEIVVDSDVVPEPSSLVAWSILSGLGLIVYRRRRQPRLAKTG